jgi:hypothetical protein
MASNDGSSGAPAGSAQLPSLLTSYGSNRPAWQVAGVDYHVGVPQGLALKDPSTISMSGVSVNTSTHIVTITGNNVTLSGYDFSLNGGWGVVISGQDATIANSNFVVGSNGNAPILGTTSSGNVTVTACTINGAGNANMSGAGLIEMRGTGTLTVNYSWLENSPYDMIDMHNNGPSALVAQYNLFQNAGLAPGAHGDLTEFIGGPYTATINYNTVTQSGGSTQGFMVEPDLGSSPGTILGGEIGYNTMMGSVAEFTGITVADLKGQFLVDNNYFDPSQTLNGLAIGGVRGGPNDSSAYSVYVHNVDMTNGSVEQDSNAPSTPSTPSTPTPPAAPAIASWSPDTGVVGDGLTDASKLTVTGTAPAGSTVNVYDGSTLLGKATASSTGAWSFTTAALANGAHKFTATDTVSGTTSASSAAVTVTVDTSAPAAPVEKTDSIVNGNQVSIAGTAEANSTVKVYDGATLVGTGVASSTGAWSATTSALSVGSHALTATATDAAGNVSAASAPLDPVIAAPTPATPAAPKIGAWSPDTGVSGDGLTDASKLTMTGTAPAGSTVNVYDGSTLLGKATASSTGAWSFTTAALANGAHKFTATDTVSGTSSASSAAVTVTVDTSAPAAPVEKTESIVNGNQVNVTGTAEANSTVKVYDGSTLVGTGVASSTGAWSATTSALSVGSHGLTATATDAAGNVSAASAALSAVVAASTPTTPTPPTAPKISAWSPDTGVTGDGLTDSSKLTMTGTAAAGSTVNVYDGSTLLGKAAASSTGAWTYATGALANGAHKLTATDTVSGATSAASAAVTVTVDTSAPAAPVEKTESIVNGNQVNVTGTAEANSTVKVYDGSTLVGTGVASSTGAWSATTSALSVGSHALAATATDAAGNVSAASAALNAAIASTTTPKGSVSFTDLWDNVSCGADIDGKADPLGAVKVYEGSHLVGATTADANGNWSLATGPLSDTVHSFTAREVNSSGAVLATSSGKAIVGTTGSDVLKSTSGNDVFFGEGSLDTFSFGAGFGHDVIADNGIGDSFLFSKSEFTGFSDLMSHASQVGDSTVITKGNDSLTVMNTPLSSLTAHQFRFV